MGKRKTIGRRKSTADHRKRNPKHQFSRTSDAYVPPDRYNESYTWRSVTLVDAAGIRTELAFLFEALKAKVDDLARSDRRFKLWGGGVIYRSRTIHGDQWRNFPYSRNLKDAREAITKHALSELKKSNTKGLHFYKHDVSIAGVFASCLIYKTGKKTSAPARQNTRRKKASPRRSTKRARKAQHKGKAKKNKSGRGIRH